MSVPFPLRLAIIGRYMRRILVLFLVFASFIVVAVGAWADSFTVEQPAESTPPIQPPDNWIAGEIKVTDLPPTPRRPSAGPAADQCSQATPLTLSFGQTADGGGTVTNLFTEEFSDPVLTCMFGTPTRPQGYRTAWYQLTAGDTGIVSITTEGTDYDTVIGVFGGSCGALVPLTCSDDIRGFQSSVTFPVVRGQTYLIEVADYKPGAPAATTLQLSAIMHEGGANWAQINNLPFGGVSRHAFVSDGPDMYVIGGQTLIGNPQTIPVISNQMWRYNVLLNSWTELNDVPGSSVSNTTAARLGKKIYIPGGFNGNENDYVNVHLQYDIPTGNWKQIQPIPTGLLPNGRMFAWASAVAAPGELGYFLTGGQTNATAQVPDVEADVLNNVYLYMAESNTWQAFQPMTTARYAHTAAWVFAGNRGLCVAGGLSTDVDLEGQPVAVLLTDGECNNLSGGWQKTGPLNFPRYNAGSAIGPDGNWYLFGGLDAAGGVPETEYYNPTTNTWHVLGSEFSLGGPPNNPPRVWPRGAFWGDSLYVFGGNTPPPESRVISSVDRMILGIGNTTTANRILFPLTTVLGADNLLADGQPLYLNTPVSGNFVHSNQFFNAYYFDWLTFGRATLRLTNVPADTDYNLFVYDTYKVVLGSGVALTGDETVSVTLEPGRYFVVVQRVFPKDLPNPNVLYTLTLSGG
jgi:N-acetylneuraminic acid mutarotase